MDEKQLIPGLFRTEYQKMVSVLSSVFGINHIEIAEDIVSDTFLSATEVWSMKGVPENPAAWLYAVAKNKTRNYLKRANLYEQKITPELKDNFENPNGEIEIDLTEKNIKDSQLAMIFVVCNPCNSNEAQVTLALNLLCGFDVNEIADAFLTNRETIYKRINRAKEKLKEKKIEIEHPSVPEVENRLDNVLKTIYLLFSEGYYSTSQNITLRKDLCVEAMRLTYMLLQNAPTNLPKVNALMALMCFHASRFEARIDGEGELILYHDQDELLWNKELIELGAQFLSLSSSGNVISQYHLEAGIAYCHTMKDESAEKWERILELHNSLLILEYSSVAALNRTYALSKVKGKQQAILAAEKLKLTGNQFYDALLGVLYTGIDDEKALVHFESAFCLARTAADKNIIEKHIRDLQSKGK
jgi:RNA polymerase sigma factor (sigma-70 family)